MRTERVAIRACTEDDAAFVVELGDDADWLRLGGEESLARRALLTATFLRFQLAAISATVVTHGQKRPIRAISTGMGAQLAELNGERFVIEGAYDWHVEGGTAALTLRPLPGRQRS